MPVVLQVPVGEKTHRLTITSAAAKHIAALPKEQHASFTEGLLRMIRASKPEVPKPLPKASTKVRKPKPAKKKREMTEVILQGAEEPST